MKTLYLVRHAKSSWKVNDLSDFDRPLNERGYHDAHAIGKQLAEKSVKPDLIISSPAIRAISTALILAQSISYSEDKIQLRKKLYETSEEEYVKVISHTEDTVNSLMLFGHNPTISQTVGKLLQKVFEDMPTCAVACLKFNVKSWEKIGEAKPELMFFIFPKMDL